MNGWEGEGERSGIATRMSTPQAAKGREVGLCSHTLSGVMAEPLAMTSALL